MNKTDTFLYLKSSLSRAEHSKNNISISSEFINLTIPQVSTEQTNFLNKLSNNKLEFSEVLKLIKSSDPGVILTYRELHKNNLLFLEFNSSSIKASTNFSPSIKELKKYKGSTNQDSFSKSNVITKENNDFIFSNPSKLMILKISSGSLDLEESLKMIKTSDLSKILEVCGFYEESDTDIHDELFKMFTTDNILRPGSEIGKKSDFKEFSNLNLLKSHKLEPIDQKNLYQSFINRRTFRDPEKNFSLEKLTDALFYLFQNIEDQDYPRNFRRIYPSAGGVFEINPYIVISPKVATNQYPTGIYRLNHEKQKLEIINDSKEIANHTLDLNVDKALILLGLDESILKQKYLKISHKLALQNAGIILSYLYLILGSYNIHGYPKGVESNRALKKWQPIDPSSKHNPLIVGQFHIV